VIGLVVVLIVVGAVAVVAGSADHPRQPKAGAQITGVATGGGCRLAYDTDTATNIPPDDSTADNVPASSVTMTKSCGPGAVVGRFSSEVFTQAGDFIHIDMRATCTATGGFGSPCTVGQQVFASPGHSFFQNSAGFEINAVNMVWTGLRKGVWRFEVLPGGNNNANLQFRTFTVEAFVGG
jgi:hypothetical protein